MLSKRLPCRHQDRVMMARMGFVQGCTSPRLSKKEEKDGKSVHGPCGIRHSELAPSKSTSCSYRVYLPNHSAHQHTSGTS